MGFKKTDKNQALTQPVVKLPVVTLSDKEMSSLNGGGVLITD